jgi:hypothetical protein
MLGERCALFVSEGWVRGLTSKLNRNLRAFSKERQVEGAVQPPHFNNRMAVADG